MTTQTMTTNSMSSEITKRINFLTKELEDGQKRVSKEIDKLEKIAQELSSLYKKLENNGIHEQNNGK